MHRFSALLCVVLGLGFGANAAMGQSCVGLQCQQVSCPGTTTTTITGTVYAPNGTDPLPNVTVYIPNAPVDAFVPGVSCPVVGAPPSGSPLVGTETDVNGNFTLSNVPVGANIPIVIISGRWRRQFTLSGTTACTNTAVPATMAVMPQNQSQGDIPKIAIATGSVDQVECVLRKVGISDSEFTDPTGTGRINLFGGGGAAGSGSVIDTGTPTQASLMGNASTLNQYDVLMLPCEGSPYVKPAQELANLINFANSGGRVYSSHYAYTWMWQNPPFNGVATWSPGQTSITSGTATVNANFSGGQTLSTWLQNVGASTSPGQMAINTLRVDTKGVIAPTQDWLDLNDATYNNPTMQFVFDTPIGNPATVNQCGRVLFNEYHVEGNSSSPNQAFPSECVAGVMTPQEKLLEYMLFELTSEGGQPTLNPTTQSFGSEAIGFRSPAQTFTWTNNSSFAAPISSVSASGDFAITANTCPASVPGGGSCTVTVVFTPTILGPETGTLSVTASGFTLNSSLTGTGTPGYSISPTTLAFGNLDIGNSASQTITLTNIASGPLPVPTFSTTGQYSVSTAACGATIAAAATCPIKVTFLPTTTGSQPGAVGVNSTSLLYNGLNAALTGNGVDFTLTITPPTGTVVAGDSTGPPNTPPVTATLTPLAGFAAPVTVTCTIATAATATACNVATASVTPPASIVITINTTSQYTVVGYGIGGHGWVWLVAFAGGWILWRTRRKASALRSGVLVILLAAIGFSMTGCSGKLPQQNAVYTGPGSYVVTVKATDGFLVRTATYTLTVTAH